MAQNPADRIFNCGLYSIVHEAIHPTSSHTHAVYHYAYRLNLDSIYIKEAFEDTSLHLSHPDQTISEPFSRMELWLPTRVVLFDED